MAEFVQIVVYTATVGSVYALVALGYSLIFSTTRVVNFAQGTLVVTGGYVAWWLYAEGFDARVSLPLVTLLAVVAAGVIGLAVYFVALAPLGRFDPATNVGWLVTTFGAGIVLQELIRRLISDEGQSLPPLAMSIAGWRGSIVADVAIQPSDLILVLATVAIFLVLHHIETRTTLGRAFRAVAQDRQTATLMGVNPTFVVASSFVIAGALAALGGVLVAPKFGTVRFNIALDLGVFGFVAAVIGGLGSTRGAVTGGYLIGLVGGIVGVATTKADTYRPLVVFAVFVVALALRPVGLFGRASVEKV
jgi:branched-chain amino acid transport system permease protein